MRAPAISHSIAALALAASGCMQVGQQDDVDAKIPGESLGFFAVTGKLDARGETCGADALGAPSTWSFEVKLSQKGSALYWLNGREAIVGQIDKSGGFSFDTRVDSELAPPRGAARGCTIVRADSASGALKGKSFTATLEFAYSETANSDCEVLIGTEGVPQALPCRLGYALSAERVSE